MTIATNFHVLTKSGGSPLLLTGNAGSPLSLTHLTIKQNAPTSGVIPNNSANGKMQASPSDFGLLSDSNLHAPFDLTLFGTDDGTNFTVTGIALGSHSAGIASDVHDILTTTGDPDVPAKQAAIQILAELRQLNRRAATIEKLVIESLGLREAATGTDR